jgi:hypothetical protein
MNKEYLWITVCIFCLIVGALLSLVSSLPYGTSIADVHGYVGPSAVVIAYVLWLAEANPTNLYFGVVVGGSLALIDKEKLFIGLSGVVLVCIARIIQYKIERKDENSRT